MLFLFLFCFYESCGLVSQTYGAQNYSKIGEILPRLHVGFNSLMLTLIPSVRLIFLFLIVDRFLLASGQLSKLVVYLRHYFRTLVWGTPGFMLLAALQQMLYGICRQ